jgi:hypothetical protein
MPFKSISTSLLLGAAALAAFRRARLDPPSGSPFFPPSQLSWIAALAMGFFLKRLIASGSQGRLIQDGSKLPKDDEYDFVIVGGGKFQSNSYLCTSCANLRSSQGTAGCVLAARLSEDPNVSVLLLEAGGRWV